MTSNDISTPKKAETAPQQDAPRPPLELLAERWEQQAAECQHRAMQYPEDSTAGTSYGSTAATYAKCAAQLREALRAQAEAEAENHTNRTPNDASMCPCANCGTVWSRAEEHRFGEAYDGEWVCSKACEDEHNALGCPFEQGDSYRAPFRDRAALAQAGGEGR